MKMKENNTNIVEMTTWEKKRERERERERENGKGVRYRTKRCT